MFAVDLAFAFIVALVFTAILVPLMGWRRPDYKATWRTAFFVFLLLFLFAWAGGVWLAPFGPTFYNVYWVPFVVIAVLYALLLLAATPPRLPGSRTRGVVESATAEAEREDMAAEAFGLFFWVLAVLLALALIVHYAL
jgi:hypothetical protein